MNEGWVKILTEGDINEVDFPAHWAFSDVLSTHLSQANNNLKCWWDQMEIQSFGDLLHTT